MLFFPIRYEPQELGIIFAFLQGLVRLIHFICSGGKKIEENYIPHHLCRSVINVAAFSGLRD